MTDGWTVRDTETGNEREAGSKADAQDKKAELERTLDMDVEIVPPESASTDGGETKAAQIESPDEDPIEDPSQPTAVVDDPEDAPQQSEVLSSEEVEEYAIEAAVVELLDAGRLVSWHGLLAPVEEETIEAIVAAEREQDTTRTLLVEKCQDALEAREVPA